MCLYITMPFVPCMGSALCSRLCILTSCHFLDPQWQGFNAEFESIVNRHKTYTVPDDALRQRLQQIATELVVPEYKAFRQRYVMASTGYFWRLHRQKAAGVIMILSLSGDGGAIFEEEIWFVCFFFWGRGGGVCGPRVSSSQRRHFLKHVTFLG